MTKPVAKPSQSLASLADDHALLCEAVREAADIALDFSKRGFEVREMGARADHGSLGR